MAEVDDAQTEIEQAAALLNLNWVYLLSFFTQQPQSPDSNFDVNQMLKAIRGGDSCSTHSSGNSKHRFGVAGCDPLVAQRVLAETKGEKAPPEVRQEGTFANLYHGVSQLLKFK